MQTQHLLCPQQKIVAFERQMHTSVNGMLLPYVCRAVLKAFHQHWLSCGRQLQPNCNPPQAFSRSWHPKQRKQVSSALGTGVKALRNGHMPGLPSARCCLFFFFYMPGCVAHVSATCYHAQLCSQGFCNRRPQRRYNP